MASNYQQSHTILQHNLGRNLIATNELTAYISQHSFPAAAVQEPYFYANSIPCPSSHLVLFDSNSGIRPRAAIIVPRNSKVLYHQQHSTPDLCVCTLTLGSSSITLISVYIPPERTSQGDIILISPYLDKIENAMRHIGGKVLICGDFNSHNPIWGSNQSDQRGKQTLDFIDSNNLHLLNDSDSPTFYTIRDGREFKSNIDITLCSSPLLVKVSDWQLCDGITCSDHKVIAINLTKEGNQVPNNLTTRIFITNGTIDWSTFSEQVKTKAQRWQVDLDWTCTVEELDRVTEKIFVASPTWMRPSFYL